MRYSRLHLIFVSCVAPALIVACGDDPAGSSDTSGSDTSGSDTSGSDTSGSDTSGADTSGSDTTPSGDTNVDDPVFQSLLGNWETPCAPVGGAYWGHNTLSVAAGSIVNTHTQYNGDPTCSDASKMTVVQTVEDSAWIIGEPVGEGVALDAIARSSVIEVLDPAVKSIWDAQSGCGPFTLDEEVDVTGKTCWGYYWPSPGETLYSLVLVEGDTFVTGAPSSGDGKTPATRPTVLNRSAVWHRVGGSSGGGFIEGTIGGEVVRAEENAGARLVQQGHIQIGATTEAVTPWQTWIVNVPNAVGTYDCEDDAINAYLNFGFTEDNLPVLWDTEKAGGAGCTIEVTKAADAVGDMIEGTFSGTLGDGAGQGHTASAGAFAIERVQ